MGDFGQKPKRSKNSWGKKGFGKFTLGKKGGSWENGPNGKKGLGTSKHS